MKESLVSNMMKKYRRNTFSNTKFEWKKEESSVSTIVKLYSMNSFSNTKLKWRMKESLVSTMVKKYRRNMFSNIKFMCRIINTLTTKNVTAQPSPSQARLGDTIIGINKKIKNTNFLLVQFRPART